MKRFALGLAFLVSSSAAADAQSAAQSAPGAPQRRSVTALRISDEARITLDGVLSEEPWKQAVPAADFIQQDPDNGKPATEQTEVYILFNR